MCGCRRLWVNELYDEQVNVYIKCSESEQKVLFVY